MIILRHNETLELNRVEYRDAISLAELKAMAAFVAIHPEHMQRDALNIVPQGAFFGDVEMADLDSLFALYRDLYATLDFPMLRRAAWICRSPIADGHVRHWLGGDARGGMSSAVRQFETYAEAGEWLVLNDAEIGLAERGEGFQEVTRFMIAPGRAERLVRRAF